MVLSPVNFYNNVEYGLVVFYTGSLNSEVISSSNGIRPSVSLVPGTMVNGGNGTANSPYEISVQWLIINYSKAIIDLVF